MALYIGNPTNILVALAVAPYLGFPMCFREFSAFALRRKPQNGSTVAETLKRVPWPIVPFVRSLFVTVYALDRYGVTGLFGRKLYGLSLGSQALTAAPGSNLGANPPSEPSPESWG